MLANARLADLCDSIVDCPHSTPVWTSSGVIVLRNQNIRNGRLDLSERSYTDEAHFLERTRRALPAEGDLVITREAPMGEVCMIPPDLRCCLGQRMVLLRPNRHHAEPRYLLYALQSAAVQNEIGVNEGTGSTVSNLRIPLLEALPIPIRSLPEQRAIAHILGTIDSKIDLNLRLGSTLDSFARALFNSWFVQFDPVRDKALGSDLALPRGIADLFPKSFSDSAFGAIPRGWSVGSILQNASLRSGGTPKTDRAEFWGGGISWASAKDVSQSRGTFLIGTERTITQQGLDESATQLIPALCSVVVARGATTGRMVLLGEAMAMNQTCYALESRTDTPFALYCELREAIDRIVHSAHGSVFATITTDTFATSKVVTAPQELRQAFEGLVAPLFHRILAATYESRTLAALRDMLLPKLISGELRIRDAERVVADVA